MILYVQIHMTHDGCCFYFGPSRHPRALRGRPFHPSEYAVAARIAAEDAVHNIWIEVLCL